MISLYLRPDKTQLVKAGLKKDRSLYVSVATELQPYLGLLIKDSNIVNHENFLEENEQDEAPMGAYLGDMFREAKAVTSFSGEEIYLVLPDSLFCLIDCIKNADSEEEVLQLIASRTGKSKEDIFYTIPVLSRPQTDLYKTVYAIERKFVQYLVDAAAEENIRLTSIEPASISFLRTAGEFKEAKFLLETFEEQAKIVSYSPVAGVFDLDVSDLSNQRLQMLTEDEICQQVKTSLIQHYSVADGTFPSLAMSEDIRFIALTENKQLLNCEELKPRLAATLNFPEFIISDIALEYQQDWMVVLGTLLQEFTEKDLLFENKPAFQFSFQSANVLPKEIQTNARFWRWKQKVKKISRFFIVGAVAAIAVEIAGIAYFSTIMIPPKLQADFDAAKIDMNDIDNEIKIINLAKTEHEYPVEAFSELVAKKPNNCGFSKISFGQKNGAKDDKTWINFTAVSTDPLVFQDYTATLSTSEMFSGVNISQIATDPSGFKTATVVVRKGKVN